MNNLWGPEFAVESANEKAKKIINKISNPKQVESVVERQLKSKKLSLEDRLMLITENVERILGKYREDTVTIRTRQELTDFIDKAIENKIISIDTETNNSLDPLTCKLMGPCFYTPGQKQIYVPLNHIEHYSGQRLGWQLTEDDVREELIRLKEAKTKVIMHNAKFDLQVLKQTTGVFLSVYWDTMIATRLIDENERSARLKNQYADKIDSSQEKYSIDHLFENIKYEVVNPEIFALYAATDAYMTYKLYEWQKRFFEDNPDLSQVLNLLLTLEVPLIEVTADMELRGIELDLNYTKKLSEKYHSLLADVNRKIEDEMIKYKSIIDAWRLTPEANDTNPRSSMKNITEDNQAKSRKVASKNSQLKEPINLSSPTQLAILLYDVLKVKSVDRLKPRGTGEEILQIIAKENNIPLCNLILEMRGIKKLIDTYVDKLPTMLNEYDNRLHGSFNQLGTDTGRFSSSEPNMQNIPAHNREIRLMFKARDNYMFVGSDYSSQEPRLTAHYSDDENMLKAFQENKDLYSVIAQSMYGNRYEDNLEFYPENTKIIIDGQEIICGNKTHQNKAGKERRDQAKSVLLGLLYGRGAASIGEQIGKTFKEGQEIINRFYASFPKVQKWIESVQIKVKKDGFVEDFYGRRRRLPDILLEPYVIEPEKKKNEQVSLTNFNPFLGVKNRSENLNLMQEYLELAKNVHSYNDYENLRQMAKNEGFILQANTNKIAQAERQSVNAIVQGGAATLTKLAMLNIYRDQELKDLGFNMLLTVHDELMGECPKENAEKVAERLSKVMIDTSKPYMKVPMKCDTYIVSHWYANEMTEFLRDEYKKLTSTMSESEAFNKMRELHTELDDRSIHSAIYEGMLIL